MKKLKKGELEVLKIVDYYLGDKLYYQDISVPDYLFKAELSGVPDHMVNGLKALQLKLEPFQFPEEGEYYRFQYSVEQEEDIEFFYSIYPYFLKTDPFDAVIGNFYIQQSDIVNFHVDVKVKKQTLVVKHLEIDYDLIYNPADSENPPTLSVSLEMSFANYNALENVPIPEEEFDEAVTFPEYLEKLSEQ